jgi:hypothetical protein
MADLESILASSPSTLRAAFGVRASSTKWLSQWGQYSSLAYRSQSPGRTQLEERLGIRILKLPCIFPERLLALFADKCHIKRLQ